jgi:hypothetical protein
MVAHDIKCIQPFFNYCCSGKKTFDLRKNDRNFKEGDTLILREFDEKTCYHTGRMKAFDITFVLNDEFEGIEKGYCIMSIKMMMPNIVNIV